jgi:hypothetical protein
MHLFIGGSCLARRRRSPDALRQRFFSATGRQAHIAAMSAFGTKQTSPMRLGMSAFGGKADIQFDRCNVRF